MGPEKDGGPREEGTEALEVATGYERDTGHQQSGWAMETPLTSDLRHRDVLLPSFEDGTVAKASNPRQGRPRGGSFVKSGPWEKMRETQELDSPSEPLSLSAHSTTQCPGHSPAPSTPLECPVTRLVFRGVSLMDLVVKPHVGDGHTVLGEGARLV